MTSDRLTIPLELRIRSPVHIGTGQEVLGSSYQRHDGKTGLLDLELVVNDYPPADRDVTAIAEGNINFSKLPNNPSTYFRYDLHNWTPLSDFEDSTVVTVVKDEQNVPYIPGSTLKGWLRTAIIYNSLGGELDQSVHKIDSNELGDRAESQLRLGDDLASDLFRCIRISDAHPIEEPPIGVCRIRTRQYRKDSKEDLDPEWVGFKIFAECILPNTDDGGNDTVDFKSEMTIDIELLRRLNDRYNGEADSIFKDGISSTKVKNSLIGAIQEFQSVVINAEKQIAIDWEYHQPKDEKQEYRHYNNFYDEVLPEFESEGPDDRFLFRSGRFTGQYSKTVMKTLSQEDQIRLNIDAPITHRACEGEIKVDESSGELYCNKCDDFFELFGLPVDPFPKTRRCVRRPLTGSEDPTWDHYPLGWIEATIN